MKPVHKFLEKKPRDNAIEIEQQKVQDEIQVEIPSFFKGINQRKFSHGGDEKRIKIFIKTMGETFDKMNQEKTPLTYFLALMQSLRDKEDALTNTTILQLISMVIDQVDEKILIAKASLFAKQFLAVETKYSSNDRFSSWFASCAIGLLKHLNSPSWSLQEVKTLFVHVLDKVTHSDPNLVNKTVKLLSDLIMSDNTSGIPTMSVIIEEVFVKVMDAKNETCLKFLHFLEQVFPYLTPKHIISISNLLIKVPKLGRDEMTNASYKAFLNLFTMEQLPIRLESFIAILKAITTHFAKSEKSSASFCPCISIGYTKLFEMDLETTKLLLPEAFNKVLSIFESKNRNFTVPAMNAVIKLILECIDDSMIQESKESNSTSLHSIIEILKNGLNFKYADNIDLLFTIYSKLFVRLGKHSNPLLLDLLLTIGQLHQPNFRFCQQLESTIGSAMSVLGPVLVLKLFPLELTDSEKRRQWMLTLLREYVSNAPLGYFVKELIPLSIKIAEMEESAVGSLKRFYKTLFEQIWMTFPAFLLYAPDIEKYLNDDLIAEIIKIMGQSSDLQRFFCNGFTKIIQKNQEILSTRIIPEGIQYSIEMATKALSCVAKSKILIPALFNAYSDASIGNKVIISSTINAMTSLLTPQQVTDYFKSVLKKLLQAENEMQQDGINKDEYMTIRERKYVMLDLTIAMAPNLPKESITLLYKVIQPYLSSEDGKTQKKAYRSLSIICSSGLLNGDELFEELKKSLSSCSSMSKKWRNHCLIELVDKCKDITQVIPQVMVEGVLGQKEKNAKSRQVGRDVIISLANKFAFGTIEPAEEVTEQQVAKLNFFIKRFLAGLGGTSVEMISGTIHCLVELITEFKDYLDTVVVDVFNSVLILLQYDHRQVTSEVINFIRASSTIFEKDFFKNFLPVVVKGLMSYAFKEVSAGDEKRRIKRFFTKLIRNYGLEEIAQHVTDPEHIKYLKNIPKEKRRTKKKFDKKSWNDQDQMDEEDEEEEEEETNDLLDPKIVSTAKRFVDKKVDNDVMFEEKKGKMIINEEEPNRKKRGREIEDIVEDDYDRDEDDVEKDEMVPNRHVVQDKKKSEGVKFGNEYKARRGTGGDMKRSGKPEPFAYIPLNPRQMNRRDRNKDSAFGSFEKEAKMQRRKK